MQKTIQITTAFGLGVLPLILYSYATGPDPRHTGAPAIKRARDPAVTWVLH